MFFFARPLFSANFASRFCQGWRMGLMPHDVLVVRHGRADAMRRVIIIYLIVMGQVLTQTQTERLQQQMRLSQQQLQVVKLLEMPIAELEQQVREELMGNPALEEGGKNDVDDVASVDDASEAGVDEDEREEAYADFDADAAMDAASQYSNDDLPLYAAGGVATKEENVPFGDEGSFIEDLEAQMVNYDLTEEQEKIVRYLIGSLDNRGYIDRPLSALADELAFKEYIYVTENELEENLKLLQSFDPPGIGARSTQECLLLQIDRRLEGGDESLSELKRKVLTMEREMVDKYFDLFIKRNKERLKTVMKLSDVQLDTLFSDIKKLNVNPGFALGESASSRVHTQAPDFIIETDLDGNIQMRLNRGEMPRLHVSREYMEQLKRYQANPKKLSRSEKEGMMYTRDKVETATMFIDSIRQRMKTMYDTMSAIIYAQRAFILSKDEDDKVRLVLDDIAKATGYDISTISRVCNSKYALLDGRIYPLSAFFKLTRTNSDGDHIDGRKVLDVLNTIIDEEDKMNPYTDEQLVEQMKRHGIKLARRTVAKYRKEAGIPSVNDRRG